MNRFGQTADLDHGQGLTRDAPRELADHRPGARVLQRDPFQTRVLLCCAGIKANLRRLAAVRPLHAPRISRLQGTTTACRQAGGDGALQPKLCRVITPLACGIGIQSMRVCQQLAVFSFIGNPVTYLINHSLTGLFNRSRILKSLQEQFVKDRLGIDRIHHIGGLINTKLLRNDFEFGLQHLPNPVFHRVFQHKVDGAHHMALADTVHAANALLNAHGVPGHVKVNNHMAELQIQTFTASIGRHQNPDLLREDLLRFCTCIQVHAAVEQDHREATAFQKTCQHGLCWHELREDQNLQGGVVFFLLQLVNQLQQGFSLRISALSFGFSRQGQQQVHLGLFLNPA